MNKLGYRKCFTVCLSEPITLTASARNMARFERQLKEHKVLGDLDSIAFAAFNAALHAERVQREKQEQRFDDYRRAMRSNVAVLSTIVSVETLLELRDRYRRNRGIAVHQESNLKTD